MRAVLRSAVALAALGTWLAAPASASIVSVGDATIQVTGDVAGSSGYGFATGFGTPDSWTDAPENIGPSYTFITTTFAAPGNQIHTTGIPAIPGVPTNSDVSWTGTTTPSLTSTSTAGLNQSVLKFEFEVEGPSSQSSNFTNVLVTANASVSGATGAGVRPFPGGFPFQSTNVEAQLLISGQAGGHINDLVQACYGIANGGSASCSATQGTGKITSSTISAQGFTSSLVTGVFQEKNTPLSVEINHIYTVTMNELVNCGASSGGANCTASMDPFLVLAPNSSSDLLLVLSPNLAAPTAAPLPGTLPLFASGLGTLGLLGWRKKSRGV